MPDDPIGDAAKRHIAQRMDEMMFKAMTGMTTSTIASADAEKPFNLEEMLRQWSQMERNWRKDNVTFVVDLGHEGPALTHDTPCDGKRVECTWQQANVIHQHWPLKLSKVNSVEQAEFVPVSPFYSGLVLKTLDMPPYELPPEEEPGE